MRKCVNMKNILGYYELSKSASAALQKGIGNLFEIDTVNSRVIHPPKTPIDYVHIDVFIGQKDDENIFVSFGASARKRTGFPYIEVFAKTKHETAEAYANICYYLINDVCYNNEQISSNCFAALLDGFEYCFFDGYSEYHDITGYWGVFILPKIKATIAGKEYLFYQIAPAYKEELEFIEKNSNMCNYKKLCKAIIEQISDRQYFDVKYDMLSEKQLNDILHQIM